MTEPQLASLEVVVDARIDPEYGDGGQADCGANGVVPSAITGSGNLGKHRKKHWITCLTTALPLAQNSIIYVLHEPLRSASRRKGRSVGCFTEGVQSFGPREEVMLGR